MYIKGIFCNIFFGQSEMDDWIAIKLFDLMIEGQNEKVMLQKNYLGKNI